MTFDDGNFEVDILTGGNLYVQIGTYNVATAPSAFEAISASLGQRSTQKALTLCAATSGHETSELCAGLRF
jgi:hypothetical protein